MADNTSDMRTYEKAPDLTGAFSAVRGELPDFSGPEESDDDISVILSGNKAVVGKALWSANGASRRADMSETAYNQETAEHEREQERMAEWDAAKVIIGGVEMTNAEAQDARRSVIRNGDYYAQWAVDHGYIAEGEKEEFKYVADRRYELAKAERENGRRTDAQQQEWNALNAFHASNAVDQAFAHAHLAHDQDFAISSNSSPVKDNPFPTVPPLTTAFTSTAANIPVAQVASQKDAAPSPRPQSSSPKF